MLRRLIDSVRMWVDIILHGKKAMDPQRNPMGKRFRIPVSHNDTFLHANGILFCGVMRKPKGFGLNKYQIIVDRHFLKLPKDEQDFLINHEKGHIRHGDTKRPANIERRIMLIRNGFVDQREIKADKYAVKKVGRDGARNALSHVSKKVSGLSKKEILARIDAIRK